MTPSSVTNDKTAIFLIFFPSTLHYMLLQFTVEELQSPLPGQVRSVPLVFYWPILFDEPMFRSRVEVKRDIPSSSANLLLRSSHPFNRLPLIIRREMSQKRCSSLGKVRLSPRRIEYDDGSDTLRFQSAQQQRMGSAHRKANHPYLPSRYRRYRLEVVGCSQDDLAYSPLVHF